MRKIPILLAGVFVLISPAFAAGGAVELPSEQMFETDGGITCGQISGTWYPGKLLKNGKFISHKARARLLRKKAKKKSGTASSKMRAKAKKFRRKHKQENGACSEGSGGGIGTPIPTPTPTPSGEAITFDFSGAVGLALGSVSVNSFDTATFSTRDAGGVPNLGSSNMKKVDSAGQTEEVLKSGEASISKFLIAPNDKLYVLFEQKTDLDTSEYDYESGCLLAEVDVASGEPICIDSELTSVFWTQAPANKPIQFDQAGAIYYAGNTSSGNYVLRRYDSGELTDLINDNIYFNDFLVLPDGRVIVTGTTQSTNAQWVRRINPNGGLSNLFTSTESRFISIFPDGNIYMGIWGGSSFGVRRYLSNTDAVDSQVYITGEGLNGITWNPVHDAKPFCDNGQSSTYQGFCGFYGTFIKAIHRTTSSKIFAIAGYGAIGELMEYYPNLSRPTTIVRKISVFQGVINNLILAGLDSNDKNVMTLFDTSDNSEVQVIGPDNEIETYRLNYVASENKIMFDGLRFSDNKYVLGQVDLSTMQVTASQTGSSKLEDFQTF